jgi:hypothetical protein
VKTALRNLAALLLVAAAAPAAETATMRGPIAGYVLDARSRTLRPVNGIPGGAALGAAVNLGFRVDRAAIFTAGDYAVVTGYRATPVPMLVKGLSSQQPAVSAIDGAIPATAMELSDDGTALVLTSAGDGKLQLVTGLPDRPQALPAVDVSGWSGGVTAAAIDATGSQVLAAAGDGSVYLLPVQGKSLGAPQWAGQVPGAAAVSFVGSGTAIVGSATSGALTLFRGLGNSLTVSSLADAAQAFQSVRAVRSAGAQRVCVADSASGKAAIVDIGSQEVRWLPTSASANRCDRLNGSVLALNQPGRDPLLLLDTSSDTSGIFFVPAN